MAASPLPIVRCAFLNKTVIIDPVLRKPVQSWQRAWKTALKEAGVHYRWHDRRHTLITHLVEKPAV
jgi:integrase